MKDTKLSKNKQINHSQCLDELQLSQCMPAGQKKQTVVIKISLGDKSKGGKGNLNIVCRKQIITSEIIQFYRKNLVYFAPQPC